MRICFMGGKQAGCIGLLTLKALGHEVAVIESDDMVNDLVDHLEIYRSPLAMDFFKDLLVSVHGRKIISNEVLARFKYGGINVHPCLWKYPGADPIGQLLRDSDCWGKVSVGVHVMTDEVDKGEVLVEQFAELPRQFNLTRNEVYNFLYPLYAKVLIEALEKRCTPTS